MTHLYTYRKTALILTALMVLMPMTQIIEAPAEIEEIIEEKTSARAVTGTLTDFFEQTNEGEAAGWVQAEGLDNTASYSLAWSVESDSDGAIATGGSQTLSTGVSNATVPINTASLVDYETYCLNATLTSGSDTIDTSSTCITIYPEVEIGGPELSVEIWGWDDGTAEAIIDIDNLAGVETYTLDWELLAGNEESIADSDSEDLTGQLSTMRSNSFTGLADDYHCLEATLSLDGNEVADAWDCFTAVMAGTPEVSAHIEDAEFGEMEVRALVWNLTSGDEYKVDITVEDTTFAIISLSETHEFNAISPAWNQESSFEQLIPGEYQVNLTVEDVTNGGIVAEWNDTFTMESTPIGPPGASFNITDAGDGRISATLDLWNLSTDSTYELVWNQTSDWVDGANGSISWEAAAHNISFAAFNAGPMPKGVYHWVVQAYVDNMHMATFYPSVSVTSQSPWSPDIGMTAYDDGFGGADIGLYAWNLEAGEEYMLDWELSNEDGTPIEGGSVIIVAAGPVHTEEIDITAIGKGEYLLTASLSDAENWYSSAGSIFEITTDPPYVDSDGDGIPDITDQCETTPPGSTVDGNGCSASQGVWASAETVIDRASIDKALGIDVADSGNYAIGGVTRESDGPSFEGFVDLGAYVNDTCAVHTNGSITCWGDDDTLPFTYKDGDYIEVEMGRGFSGTSTCALDTEGTIECWNYNDPTSAFFPPDGSSEVTIEYSSLDGSQHYCAITKTSEIVCWGRIMNGAISEIPEWDNFTKVSTGYRISCGLTDDKHIECWGRTSGDNGNPPANDPPKSFTDGPYSDLAAATRKTCTIELDKTITCYGRGPYGPSPSAPPGTFKAIESSPEAPNQPSLRRGMDFDQSKHDIGFCAISTDGNLSCWGGPDNIFSTISYDGRPVTDVKVGAAHVCVIDDLGEVWCSNQKESNAGIPDIHAGYYHTCAVLSSGGVECWGGNSEGQLGDGTKTDSNVPVSVTGITNAIAVDAATSHSCALLTTGNVQCWGANYDGQLGGSPNSEGIASVSGITNAIAIALGSYHSCALLSTGAVQCWGWNTEGQLGNGNPGASNINPVSVTGITDAIAIASEHHHTCVVLASGEVNCWGQNSGFLLGDGTDIDRHAPVSANGITNAINISTGREVTCALLATGSVQCWGRSSGDWNLDDITDAVAISANHHACAIMSSGEIQCWGRNYDGQLGDGSSGGWSSSSRPNPTTVNGITNAVDISTGYGHTCAIQYTGSVLCWGKNSEGQLGDGTAANRNIPTPVIGLSSNTQVQMSDWSKPVTGEASGSTPSTYDDGFIQYYDDSGTLLWSKLIAGENNDTVNSVAVDSDGNVIACGFFRGDVDFGDSTVVSSTMDGSQDGFIAKYDSSGALLWTRLTSSPQNAYMENYAHSYDTCNEVVTDDDGTIFAVGRYYSYGRGTSDVSSVGTMTTTLGYRWTGYVARIDASGTTEWINTDRGTYNIHDIALTPDGDVAIAGTFGYTCHCEVDFGGDKFTKTSLGTGGFVAKMDGSTGAFLWGDAVSGPSWVHGLSVASTSTGEIYTTGVGYILNFSDGDSVDPEGGSDVYVIKYTENGDMIWKRYFGSDANDGANDLVTDEEGGVLVVGAFGRWIHYGNGQSFGGPWGIGMDVYVARLGPNGDFSWFRNGGGTVSLWRFDGDVGTSMDFGPDGTLHVVGHHFYNASFGDHDIGTDQGRAGFHATMTFDTDGDGVHDSSDSCPGTIPAFVADGDGCAPYQLDSDGDGITDNHDQCPGTPAGATVNGLGCEPPTTDETPTCSMYTTTTLGQVETIGVSMETKPEWVSLNYQRALLSEGVYDVGLHCVDPNGDEFSLELAGPVESVQGSGSDVWIYLTDELLKGYETAHRFDYTWTQATSQENGYAHLILIDPAMVTNATKRVALWGGKVNQHWDVDDLEWKTDPDGTSGAGIGALATCKKWYPDTAAVELMQHRETITFWTAGNSDPYESTKPIWECVADDDPRVLSGALQSGEVVEASTGTILATILLTTAACGIGAIAVSNRKGGKVEFEDDEDEDEGENKDDFIK